MKNRVRVNENIIITLYEKNGCPIAQVDKLNESVTEYFIGAEFFADLFEVGGTNKNGFELIRYNDNPNRYNELHEMYFTEEEDKAITKVLQSVA